ncbi:MAG: hypothetical protein ABIQ11_06575, partial [Saprospiraceae bacterium]
MGISVVSFPYPSLHFSPRTVAAITIAVFCTFVLPILNMEPMLRDIADEKIRQYKTKSDEDVFVR